MIKCLPSAQHFLVHLEYVIIWLMLVLKTSDYWIQAGGTEFLPEKWVYLSQLIDQKLLVCFGLGCSTIICYVVLAKKLFPIWNLALGSLWIMMFFFPYPLGRVGVSISLCTVASVQIISRFCRRKSFLGDHRSKKVKGENSNENLLKTSVVNQPCGLDLSKLDSLSIGSSRKTNTPSLSAVVPSSPTGFAKPRPVISPSRFSSSSIISSHGANLTKASWVAGGYWQSNNWPSPTFSSPSPSHNTPLTRSSSQSSGFGSVQTGLHNRSPPDSRPDSTLEEIDRFSVFSDNLEPRYSDSSLRFPESSPNLYQYANELSRKSLVSSISSTNGTPTTPLITNQWSWLPFMFGFSLAVNVCVLTYFVFLYSSSKDALKLHL